MSTVSSVTNTSTLYDGANLTGANSQLNQADFLKLLVSQIQYQDPLNPKSNTDMAAQMAQFTSLQQATDTSSSLAMMQANSLIGTSVTLTDSSQNIITGLVSGVTIVNGQPQIIVNGQHYQVNQVTLVQPPGQGKAAAVTPTTTDTTPQPTTLTTQMNDAPTYPGV